MKTINFKHLLASLVAVLVSVGGYAHDVFADGFYWNLSEENKTAEVTYYGSTASGGTGAYSGNKSIPSVIKVNGTEYRVTSIGGYAFYDCTGLTSITIPESVTSIGGYAFSGCSGLTSITIPESVTSIGSSAFYGCTGLTTSICVNKMFVFLPQTYEGEYIIPSGTEEIVGGAFSGCKGLTSITIPESVTSIGSSAFSGCTGLTSVNIPESVTSIGSYAFSGCTGLTSITIPGSVTTIGQRAFSGCTGLTSITIPSSVTTIGHYTFYGCTGLTSVTIPESVTFIGNQAFWGCTGLTSITIPESVTSIGSGAFEGCTGLTAITIPSSVTSIGTRAFRNCTGELILNCDVPQFGTNMYGPFSESLFVSVTVNGKNIGSRAFSGCSSIRDLNLGENVTSIAEVPFRGCSGLERIQVNEKNKIFDSRNNCNAIIESEGDTLILGCKNTVIPESVTSIGSNAFQGCTGLTSITIPSSVTTIGHYTFYGCTGLTSITIPENVSSIGESAFNGCTGLTSVNIPEGVTSIEEAAFYYCSGLTSITIPESVKEIKSGAFRGCSNIKSVNALSAIPPTITEGRYYDDVAFSVYSTAFLYVPLGCEEAYGTATGWSKFAKIREKDFGTKDCLLTIKGLSGGSIALKCKTRSAYSFLITSEEGWGVSSVTFNGSDVTADVADDGTYTTPSLTDNSELSVVFEKSGSAVKEVMTDDPLYVSAGNGALYINNADKAMKATVYTADGKKVKQAVIPVGSTRIPLSEGQLYIIKIGERTFKVTM